MSTLGSNSKEAMLSTSNMRTEYERSMISLLRLFKKYGNLDGIILLEIFLVSDDLQQV